MSEIHSLTAEMKERAGKGAARATRREGRVPAVIYGAKKPPVMITLDPRDVTREIHKSGFWATLFDISVGGNKERVLARDLQLHPVGDYALHIDFLRVSASTEVTIEVPCHFVNEEQSPGLERGGVLNIVRHEIEVTCRASDMPQEIVIDLTGLEIGDGVHISMVKLPDGVRPAIQDRDFTIATVAAPTVVADEAAEEAAEAEAEAAAEAEAEAEGEEGEGVEGEEGAEGEGEDKGGE